jgi:hypothetical protein
VALVDTQATFSGARLDRSDSSTRTPQMMPEAPLIPTMSRLALAMGGD